MSPFTPEATEFLTPTPEDYVSLATIIRGIATNHAITISMEQRGAMGEPMTSRWSVTVDRCTCWDEHLGLALIRAATMAEGTQF